MWFYFGSCLLNIMHIQKYERVHLVNAGLKKVILRTIHSEITRKVDQLGCTELQSVSLDALSVIQ